MPSEEFLKEQERISLAEELMDLALMARGTQKLFSLIGKECVFDLENLQSKMNGLTKAQRDALEIKQVSRQNWYLKNPERWGNLIEFQPMIY